MSLFGSLAVSVSGMQSQSSKLGVISQNISNVNTIGYKQGVASFADLMADDNVPSYSPSGVVPGSTSYNRSQGDTNQTESGTDIAIIGDGFFAVKESLTSANSINSLLYTRAGDFRQDENGNFVNRNGFFLQGWALDSSGNLPTALSANSIAGATGLAALQTINIQELNNVPSPTSTVTVKGSLNPETAAYSGTPVYDPTLLTLNSANMASGDIDSHFSSTGNIIDSTGASHEFEFAYLKTGVNTWAVEVYAKTPADVTADNGLIAYGTVTFNGDGTLASVSPTLLTAPIAWTNTAAAPSAITMNFGTAGAIFGTPNTVLIGRNDGLSQTTGNFSQNINHNGIEVAEFSGIKITEDGYVQATYKNGTSHNFFKIPLADFIEPNQLTSLTGDVFRQSNTSGAVSFRQSGEDNAGEFLVGALESSNVDTATELTNLLIAQRAYQFNSKIASTTDSMLDKLTTMVR